MISFEIVESQLVLSYQAEFGRARWVDVKLKKDGHVTLSRVFTVQTSDVLNGAGDFDEDQDYDDLEGEVWQFAIGTIDGDYQVIRRDVLGLEHDLLVAKSVHLERRMFVAERNISVFGRIDDLVGQQIVIGGDHPDAIPVDEFDRLLREFPTSNEVRYYAQARVTRVLRDYMETMSDADARLSNYMDRRRRELDGEPVPAVRRVAAARELELEKFTYVRDRLVEMLKEADSYSEAEWQKLVAELFLLVYPQYVAVLQGVQIKERYSNKTRATNRFVDLMLVDANGSIDIIEIKKPFRRGLVSKGRYRDNHVPVRELSGSIMQAEKYLFYLSKLGQEGEQSIAAKHEKDLPDGLNVKITNPKAIILSGRDLDLSERERFDFEFVRRQYSNLVDIITYDDLLRRVENVIAALSKPARSGADEAGEPA